MHWRVSSAAVSKSRTSAEESRVVCCTASAEKKIGQMWDCFTSRGEEMILLNNSGKDASLNVGTVLMQLLFCSVRIYCLVMDTNSFTAQSQF